MHQVDNHEVFDRIISASGLTRLRFDDPVNALQHLCAEITKIEQRWLDELITSHYPAQPRVLYGFYESSTIQAHCVESTDCPEAVIAVSCNTAFFLRVFFRRAMAQHDVLPEFGNASAERSLSINETGNFAIQVDPVDPERGEIADLMTLWAVRFLTAHELSHVLNGHIRSRLQSQVFSITERPEPYPFDCLFSQTLEMDADSGALLECLPAMVFTEATLESNPKVLALTMGSRSKAIHIWMFCVYSLFRVMSINAKGGEPERSSHPPIMVRMMMIMALLRQVLEQHGHSDLVETFDEKCGATVVHAEWAFSKVFNQLPDHTSTLEAAGIPMQSYVSKLLANWKNVRPSLLGFARGRKLAP